MYPLLGAVVVDAGIAEYHLVTHRALLEACLPGWLDVLGVKWSRHLMWLVCNGRLTEHP